MARCRNASSQDPTAIARQPTCEARVQGTVLREGNGLERQPRHAAGSDIAGGRVARRTPLEDELLPAAAPQEIQRSPLHEARQAGRLPACHTACDMWGQWSNKHHDAQS